MTTIDILHHKFHAEKIEFVNSIVWPTVSSTTQAWPLFLYFYKNKPIFHSKKILSPHGINNPPTTYRMFCVLVEVVCVCVYHVVRKKMPCSKEVDLCFCIFTKTTESTMQNQQYCYLVKLQRVHLPCCYWPRVIKTETLAHFPSGEIANTRDCTSN